MVQVVDPAVSRAKFNRDLDSFKQFSAEHRARGWFLVEAEFPTVTVLLTSPKMRPVTVVFAVRFDYTNYDFDPPSVRFVDALSGRVLTAHELPNRLPQAVPIPQLPYAFQSQELLQAYGQDKEPFLCISGVREYHEHPGHTGDSWFLHRVGREGDLSRLLHVIYRNGVEPIQGYQIGLTISGFRMGDPVP